MVIHKCMIDSMVDYCDALQVGSVNFSRFLKSVEDDDVDNIISVKLYQNDLVAVNMPENIMTTNIDLHSQVLCGRKAINLSHFSFYTHYCRLLLKWTRSGTFVRAEKRF